MIISYPCNPVYLKSALVTLGIYGFTHEHSRLWVPAVTRLIQRKGVAHE
jgi:hypothetical protein